MKVSLFYLPGIGSQSEVQAGRVGLRGELYDQMLREISEQAKLADVLGYDSISFTEHHFHVEGFEVSNNPVLLDLYIGMQTRRLRVGQLGVVLPANNPIRVAEDIAMLDHMTGGRANAGFARGYQRRWVDIMAQQTHGIHGAHPHQHDAIDEANRAAFEECYRIIKQAWTQDSLSYQGKYWRVPPGETPWPIEATQKWGSGVENGIVKAVSVVPKPLQKPQFLQLPRNRIDRTHQREAVVEEVGRLAGFGIVHPLGKAERRKPFATDEVAALPPQRARLFVGVADDDVAQHAHPLTHRLARDLRVELGQLALVGREQRRNYRRHTNSRAVLDQGDAAGRRPIVSRYPPGSASGPCTNSVARLPARRLVIFVIERLGDIGAVERDHQIAIERA
jgi:Luciferase-like monooxygenase